MRKISLTAALIAATLSTAAVASDWVLVTATANLDAFFIDRESIRTQPNGYKRAWERNIYAEPENMGITSAELLEEYDCRERRRRTIHRIYFKGEDATTNGPGTQGWMYVRPDSIGEHLLEYVCFGKLPE